MIDTTLLKRFTPVLTNRTNPPVKEDPRLLMEKEGKLAIYYVPFERRPPEIE